MSEIAFAAIIVASFFAPEPHPFLVGASFFGLVANAAISFEIRTKEDSKTQEKENEN